MEQIRKQRLENVIRTAYNRSDLVVVPFLENPWGCPYDTDQVDFTASYTIEEKGKIGNSVFGRLYYWHEDANGWLLEIEYRAPSNPLGVLTWYSVWHEDVNDKTLAFDWLMSKMALFQSYRIFYNNLAVLKKEVRNEMIDLWDRIGFKFECA